MYLFLVMILSLNVLNIWLVGSSRATIFCQLFSVVKSSPIDNSDIQYFVSLTNPKKLGKRASACDYYE